MSGVVNFYVSLLPVIITGIVNAVFCKSHLLDKLKIPIDCHKTLKDGQRVFGDHKTLKGFIGYIIFAVIFSVIFGLISTRVHWLERHNFFYFTHNNNVVFNFMLGSLLGFTWTLFELPNSFLKRRLKIAPGFTSKNNFMKILFVFLDQADSIFGVVLVIAIFHPIFITQYFLYVVVGALTHIALNYLLFLAKIRKRPV